MRSVFAALFLASLAAAAQPWDPALTFQTIETEHFLLHFHDGEEPLARRSAALAEEAHAQLVPLLGYTPREKTHIVLVDVDDAANGSAIPVPRNTIVLRAASPDSRTELHQAEDWAWNLIVHEYTHVLHTDNIGGPARILNLVFGKSLFPNGAWPRWFLEGLAVWTESELSVGGRLRSSLHDMQLRTHILEERALTLGELSNLPLEYPRLSTRYLYGGRFVDHVARAAGHGAIRGIVRENGASIIPYFLDTLSERHTGLTFDAHYDAWLGNLRLRAATQVAAVGTPSSETVLTHHGETRRTPRLSLDGKTVYSLLLDADERPRVQALDLGTGVERTLATVNGDGALAMLPDGRILAGQPAMHGAFRSHDELFVIDPKNGDVDRLTHGARLSDPDVARDGRIVAVRRSGPGLTELVSFDSVATFDTPKVLHASARTVASPRFSPNGRRIVFLEQLHDTFDLRLLDLDTGAVRTLTEDGAQDLNPAFTSDDEILFSSDRTGIYDIHAINPDDGTTTRLTRVVGGAFEPLRIDGALHYVRAGAAGMDLAKQPEAQREAAIDAKPLATEPARPSDVAATTRPYSALDTLAPTLRIPLLGGDARGLTLGITIAGADVLQRWRYGASGWWGLSSREPGFSASVAYDGSWPSVSAYAGRRLDLVADAPDGYAETVLSGGTTVSWNIRSWWSAIRIDAGWDASHFSPSGSFAIEPGGPPAPERGLLSTARLGFTFSSARRFQRSISTEGGRRFAIELRGSNPWLGSDFTTASAAASWTEFVALPAHNVLAFRAGGGLGIGELGGRRLFALGGPAPYPSIDEIVSLQSPTRILRGFPRFAFTGRAYWLATAEWRFPLATLELAPSTLPIQVRRLHGAVFVDAGSAFDPGRTAPTAVGTGVELRTELVFGYNLVSDLRLGYAKGVTTGGRHQFLVLLGTQF